MSTIRVARGFFFRTVATSTTCNRIGATTIPASHYGTLKQQIHIANNGSTTPSSTTTNHYSRTNNASYQLRWQSSVPTHEVVGMPSLSPTMESGTIANWNVKEGESFAAGDSLCEVETDKATVSFEAQDDGFVAKIIAQAGAREIQCGEPILITVEEESHIAAFQDYAVPSAHEAAPASADATPAPSPPPPAAASTPTSTTPATPDTTAIPTAPPSTGRVTASPRAFMTAKDRGIDLSTVSIAGTGPGGRILADDVREWVPPATAAADSASLTDKQSPVLGLQDGEAAVKPVAKPVVGEGYTDFPLTAAGLEIASQLSSSKQSVPHYYLTVDITLDSLLSLRSTLNQALNLQQSDDSSTGISLNDLLVKAAASAMKACPSANASWMGTVVRVYDSVDVNVVIGNGDALYSPVIRNCDKRGVKSISDEISSALLSVSGGGLDNIDEKFSAIGTVTVMNMGMYGIKTCAPIIRQPQAVALALGAAENRIVPNDDDDSEEIYKESIMLTATLSCDHRVVDGAVGAQWLSAFKSLVENPTTLLL